MNAPVTEVALPEWVARLTAIGGELPAIREGRSILLPKHLLVVKLLGREP